MFTMRGKLPVLESANKFLCDSVTDAMMAGDSESHSTVVSDRPSIRMCINHLKCRKKISTYISNLGVWLLVSFFVVNSFLVLCSAASSPSSFPTTSSEYHPSPERSSSLFRSANMVRCGVGQFLCSDGSLCIPNQWRCNQRPDCKDGSDEKDCVCKDIMCKDHSKCIFKKWVCDGVKDCADGSDELDCPLRNCTRDEFTCDESKKCIQSNQVCDQKNDCDDGSDERNCTVECDANEFKCTHGLCIDLLWRCDGHSDCPDSSDEVGCKTHKCSDDQFTCGDGKCIPRSFKCDGNLDCRDETDELNCNYTTVHHVQLQEGFFQCKNSSKRIPTAWQCDQEEDCDDKSDEEGCRVNMTCPQDHFPCKNAGNCLPIEFRCNGKDECTDRSDELGCKPGVVFCPTDTFPCHRNRKCIRLSQVCDDTDDCGDWSDEPKELCHINECNNSNHNCSQICNDDKIGYHCACESGFRLSEDKHTCSDINECSEVHGVCSGQKCFNTLGHYKCDCYEGYELIQHRYCRAKGSEIPYLAFANRYDIRRAQLSHSRAKFLHYSTIQNRRSIAIDYNLRENFVVWSDGTSNQIMIHKLSNSSASLYRKKEPTVLIDDVAHAFGLALDWVHNLLYWTDEVYGTISVVAIKKPQNKITLFKGSDVRSPRPIAVNVKEKFIVWADWATYSIERASQDGTNRKKLLSTESDGYPSVLTIDILTRKIYWIDSKFHSLGVLNFDGSHHKTLVKSSKFLPFPFSMDVFEDYIYFSDWKKEAIMQININGDPPVARSLIEHLDEQPMAVKIVHSLKQPKSENVCEKAKCSHLCLPSENETYRCVCRHGYTINSDNFTCINDSAKVNSTITSNIIHKASTPLNTTSKDESPSTSSSYSTKSSSRNSQQSLSRNDSTDKQKSMSNSQVLNNNNYNIKDDTKGREISKMSTQKSSKNDKVNRITSNIFPERDAHLVIIICAVFVTIILLVTILIFVIQRTYNRRNITAMNFDNPVYRKTTEEQFVLKKSEESVNSFPSSLEPLTSPGTNEFV